jgi:flagellar hook-associated protein 3 FlgL
LEPQFLGAGWEANWSSATDDAIVTRIALNETARTSVSANLGGVRKLAMASTMISELLGTEIGGAASDAVITRATELVSEALAEIADAKAATGITEQRVSEATERLRMQVDIFERSVLDLEGVDPYEASTRVSALLGQIELSYSLTARIQELSLARYLT